jgi:lipoprotein-releasing system ATP-binding protein
MIPLLKAKNISKSFYYPVKRTIFNQINLQLMAGESIAIIGRSGEGKSTLLQILGMLEEPCEGELFIGGEKATRFNRSNLLNQKIGFVFQSFHLLEDYSAIDNVLMPARIGRQSIGNRSQARERAAMLLERVGLSSRADYPTKLLSGGEKQRVALARALCNNPTMILADEPSGNLDSQTAEWIHTLLLDFTKEAGKGLIIVTHDRNLANLCTNQLELQDGHLLAH